MKKTIQCFISVFVLACLMISQINVAYADEYVVSLEDCKSYYINDNEIEMIESVVMHEVGYCSEESMIAVTHIILNRLKNPLFPDNVYDILHAEDQFTAIHNYYDHTLPVTKEVKVAVKKAFILPDTINGAVYYCNFTYIKDPKTINWFRSLIKCNEIDGQEYFK